MRHPHRSLGLEDCLDYETYANSTPDDDRRFTFTEVAAGSVGERQAALNNRA